MDRTTISNPQWLKARILRRVYWTWFLRRIAPLLTLELMLVVGVLIGVFTYISPRQILLNALSSSSGLTSFVQFFIDNFFVKSIQSRLLLALWVGSMAYVLRDVRQAVFTLRAFPLEPAKARTSP